jgi:glycosyltransferase involved in cell wall biosynthesis
MRILMTADAAGGVGVFAAELAAGLQQRGHRVLMVVFSPTQPAVNTRPVEWVWAPFRLEWMDSGGDAGAPALDAQRGRAFLAQLGRRWRAELLHSNQFAYVAAVDGVPTLLSVHSDVVSWWRTVRRSPPPDNAYQRWYRAQAAQALASADGITVPSASACRDLLAGFACPRPVRVIHNGRCPDGIPSLPKQALAVAAGRLWDQGKRLSLLGELPLPLPLEVAWAGEAQDPSRPEAAAAPPGVHACGRLSAEEMARLLARARAYIGTSVYEPFGLAVLEAALADCALVLNDIPSWRELWSPVAQFYSTPAELHRWLQRAAEEPRWAEAQGKAARQFALARYSAGRMVDQYEDLMRSLR